MNDDGKNQGNGSFIYIRKKSFIISIIIAAAFITMMLSADVITFMTISTTNNTHQTSPVMKRYTSAQEGGGEDELQSFEDGNVGLDGDGADGDGADGGCPSGFTLQDGACFPSDECGEGYTLLNGTCIPVDGGGQPGGGGLECEPGYVLQNDECVLRGPGGVGDITPPGTEGEFTPAPAGDVDGEFIPAPIPLQSNKTISLSNETQSATTTLKVITKIFTNETTIKQAGEFLIKVQGGTPGQFEGNENGTNVKLKGRYNVTIVQPIRDYVLVREGACEGNAALTGTGPNTTVEENIPKARSTVDFKNIPIMAASYIGSGPVVPGFRAVSGGSSGGGGAICILMFFDCRSSIEMCPEELGRDMTIPCNVGMHNDPMTDRCVPDPDCGPNPYDGRGQHYNTRLNRCVENVICPQDQHFIRRAHTPYANACVPDPRSDNCIRTLCIPDPIQCMRGWHYDVTSDECVENPSCPAGQRYHAQLRQCVPMCDIGSRYDITARGCLRDTSFVVCGNPNVYDERSRRCVAFDSLCDPGYRYSPLEDRCLRLPIDRGGMSYWGSTTGVCADERSRPVGSTTSTFPGWYDVRLHTCVENRPSCPADHFYDGIRYHACIPGSLCGSHFSGHHFEPVLRLERATIHYGPFCVAHSSCSAWVIEGSIYSSAENRCVCPSDRPRVQVVVSGSDRIRTCVATPMLPPTPTLPPTPSTGQNCYLVSPFGPSQGQCNCAVGQHYEPTGPSSSNYGRCLRNDACPSGSTYVGGDADRCVTNDRNCLSGYYFAPRYNRCIQSSPECAPNIYQHATNSCVPPGVASCPGRVWDDRYLVCR